MPSEGPPSFYSEVLKTNDPDVRVGVELVGWPVMRLVMVCRRAGRVEVILRCWKGWQWMPNVGFMGV